MVSFKKRRELRWKNKHERRPATGWIPICPIIILRTFELYGMGQVPVDFHFTRWRLFTFCQEQPLGIIPFRSPRMENERRSFLEKVQGFKWIETSFGMGYHRPARYPARWLSLYVFLEIRSRWCHVSHLWWVRKCKMGECSITFSFQPRFEMGADHYL